MVDEIKFIPSKKPKKLSKNSFNYTSTQTG